MHRLSLALSLVSAGLALAPAAHAQAGEGATDEVVLQIDTGLVRGHGVRRGSIDVPSTAFHLYAEGAVWMRVFFGDVELGGGARLRLTSLADGGVQTLDAASIVEWGNTSAYFNGDVVLVELLEGSEAGTSRVRVDRVRYGIESFTLFSICGTDDRLATTDPSIARLLPIGCTGFLIDDANGGLLTAGHCMGSVQIAEFNVPPSNENGTINHPSPTDQYVVDAASVQSNGGQGIGDDWAYFGVQRNGDTGLTVREVQGPGFQFRPPPTWTPGVDVRITGFGIDAGPPNQVLQTSVGEWLPYAGEPELQYGADTMGGNSGGPVQLDGTRVVMGIHTHGGCALPTFGNKGTTWDNPGLQAALANPLGVLAAPGVRPGAGVRNGLGANPWALSSVTNPVLGRNWSFRTDASGHPGATHVVSVASVGGAEGKVVSMGELLVDLGTPLVFQTVIASSGALDTQTLAIPNDTILAGVTCTVQSAFVGGAGPELTNALDLLVGCHPDTCP